MLETHACVAIADIEIESLLEADHQVILAFSYTSGPALILSARQSSASMQIDSDYNLDQLTNLC